MLNKIKSAALIGVDGFEVTVECSANPRKEGSALDLAILCSVLECGGRCLSLAAVLSVEQGGSCQPARRV